MEIGVDRLKPEGCIELVIDEFRHFVEAAAGEELLSAPVHIRGIEFTARQGNDSLFLKAKCPVDDNNGTPPHWSCIALACKLLAQEKNRVRILEERLSQ